MATLDDYVTTDGAAAMAGLKADTIRHYRLRAQGDGFVWPEPDRYVLGRPLWKRTTVERWIKDHAGKRKPARR